MAKTTIAVLSGQSLFADGTASRLHQHSQDVETFILDPSSPDTMLQLAELQPSAVIIDSHDPNLNDEISLPAIFHAVPKSRVVMLNSQSSGIQILTVHTVEAEAVRDLIELLATEDPADEP